MALRGWRRWASEQLCHEDPGATADALRWEGGESGGCNGGVLG